MLDAFANHLWQSTVFGVVVALLVFAFRRHGAHVRHWLWFAASLKFCLPFAVLAALGGYIPWTPASPSDETVALSQSLTQLGEPFAGGWSSGVTATESLPAHPSSTWPAALLVVWVFGTAVIVSIRVGQWWRVRAAIRASAPWRVPGLALPRGMQARTAPGLLEPGDRPPAAGPGTGAGPHLACRSRVYRRSPDGHAWRAPDPRGEPAR